MKRIYKYALELSGKVQHIARFPHSEIVLVAVQNGRITLWVECDPIEFFGPIGSSPSGISDVIRRSFRIYATGDVISDRDKHVGSVLMDEYVWHVYEVL